MTPFRGRRCQYLKFKSVRQHTVPAEHLYDKAAFSLIRLILNMTLAAFNGRIFVSYIAESALEDGEKRLVKFRGNESNIED